ncbi:response regulator [Chryseolinea sp. H1M3-3]|uniref:response regulator n=1 Tax=Chryseolinea sp. H1M3-3 TaxID=3034144 RepID=UPI0023ED4754|nr:response regulator [Chryseolinea sp. H1M3-3]
MIYYKNLLLIDDDEDDHEFFLEAVREIDNTINCICLYDGEMALCMLREKKSLPDLIILDTNMPKTNGRQILTELKSDPELRDIPVIMYSTLISERDNSELQKLGAAHYLAKPSKFEDFLNALNQILRRRW